MAELKPIPVKNYEEAVQLLEASVQASSFPVGGGWNREKIAKELQEAKNLGHFDDQGLSAALLYRENPQAFEVTLLATDPKLQKSGLMQDLLKKLHQMAQAASRELWLEVHEGNLPALRLYKKLGFSQTGMRKNYYADRGSAIHFLLR